MGKVKYLLRLISWLHETLFVTAHESNEFYLGGHKRLWKILGHLQESAPFLKSYWFSLLISASLISYR